MINRDLFSLTHLNWRLLFQLSLLFIAIGALFYPSISFLYDRWTRWDEDLSHAIPTLALFFVLAIRNPSAPYVQDSLNIKIKFLVILTALSVIWFLFIASNIVTLANIVIFFSLPIVMAACLSKKTAIYLLAPAGILFFTLPIFSQLNSVLIEASAFVVGSMVHEFGVTALIDGQNIYLSSGHIYIAEGCSGLRYLTIALLMGYLVSIFNNYSISRGLYTLCIAIVLGLLTNWIRIFSLVMIGNYTTMKSSLMHNHELFGWLLFASIMIPSIYFSPVHKAKKIDAPQSPPRFTPLLPLLALAVGPLALLITEIQIPKTSALSLEALSENNISTATPSPFTPELPEHPLLLSHHYKIDNFIFDVKLAQYIQADNKSKLVPYFESLLRGEEWRNMHTLNSSNLEKFGFKAMALKRINDQQFQLMIYRYEVGKYNTSSYEVAKILQLPATIIGDRYFNIFEIDTPCEDEFCEPELKSGEKLALDWAQKSKKDR